jgi:crossover junction endodeoxyribonuclease RuvC
MIMAGYDPGLTKPALVVLDGDVILHQRVYKNDLRGIDRLIWLRNQIMGDLIKFKVDYVGAESPAFGAPGQEHARGQIDGVIEVAMIENNIPYCLIAPGQLKKFILGSGKGEKNLILLKTYQEYGVECNDDNIADAFILAKITQILTAMDEAAISKLKKHQKEVILSIMKE